MWSIRTLCVAVSLMALGVLNSARGEQLKIGFILPMTGSAALMGESLSGVVKLAQLKNVSTVFEDDRCDAKLALSAYTKLRGEGVRLFYMACSGSILAVAPLAKQNGDLIVTTYAGSARIRETGPEVLRYNPDAISIAEGLTTLLTPDMLPTAFLYEEQDYAQSLVTKLESILGSAAVIEKIAYRPDSPSFASEVLRLKQKKSKSIVFVPVGDGAARLILQQMSQQRMGMPILGDVNLCDYPFHPSDFKLSGACVSARFSGKPYDDFLRDYASVVGHAPAYPFYDAIALDLVERVDGVAKDGASIAELRTQLLAPFAGKFTRYSLSPDGEAEHAGDYLTRVRY